MKSTHHLVMVDEEGSAAFYLLTAEAYKRYGDWNDRNEHDNQCLFEWITGRRKGVKRFDSFRKLCEHLLADKIVVDDNVLSTSAY